MSDDTITTDLDIDEMYAFVAVDPADRNEGIIAISTPDGGMLPLVGADMRMVEKLRDSAQQIADLQRLTVRLVRFTNRELLEVITPA